MICLSLPMLPPSTNHAYRPIVSNKRAMLVMTSEGKKFKTVATAHLSKSHQPELVQLKPNKPYVVFFRFTVTDLVNKGWANGTTARYKRHDVSNRFKLMEDVLADVSAVDDANFMMVAGQKVQGEVERTDIYIWNLEEEGSPLDAAVIRL